jgi:hypothetical protein
MKHFNDTQCIVIALIKILQTIVLVTEIPGKSYTIGECLFSFASYYTLVYICLL